MGRRKLYTSEEDRKEKKKIYDLQYQNNRYKQDPEYRAIKKLNSYTQYHYKKAYDDPLYQEVRERVRN